MPHLNPERVLERFSTFLQEDVRAEIDDEFIDGQVGSMSSTLSYLASELRLKREMTIRQRQALVDGLETVTRNCDDLAVSEAAERGRERIAEAQTGDTTELESVLIETCNDVLETINEELAGSNARDARAPLYEFLRVRVDSQLAMLGRDSD
ncbi:hypothetical protein CP556_17365 [Natrinema sp. CBA1119]|uniref:hypothetical protein n=1 Tax=Natrinema sp. CBA1119 TaxID=1608465 RepID=UPI000BFA1BC4|nr:hypothetical protein [Natrinema sp. CBA1119]PGF17690.1 hypothetical protein CP556_17365 [Natrinema sp. CBA1119]